MTTRNGTPTRYDAFLAYAHADKEVAVAIHTGMRRLATPRWSRSKLRIFRDDTKPGRDTGAMAGHR